MNRASRIPNVRRSLLTILALLIGPESVSQAATYYVDGNNPLAGDANPGTLERPWQTISKATPLLEPGDTLMIQAGTYRETITLSRSGTAAAPITIQAFPGQEGRVVIDAAEPVTNWTRCAGPEECNGNPQWSHIYYAEVGGPVAAHPDPNFAVRQLFQHDHLLPRSRFPDAGWRYPTSIADPKKMFTDSSLFQPEGFFSGAMCHIKTAVWQLDPVPITAFSRGTITLAAEPRFNITPRFGYFLTSIVGEINQEGEWAYEPGRKRLYLWPKGGAAEDLAFSYREYCLRTTGDVSFNIARGLTMRNAYHCGIQVHWSHDFTIEDNTVEYCFDRGIHLAAAGGSCNNNRVLRNTIKHCSAFGIVVDQTASHNTIEGNYVYATGVEHFGDDLLNGLGEAVFVWGPYARVRQNRVDRTARGALYLGGQPIHREICFNHVTQTGLALSDGGSGLYTGGYHPGPETDHIHHNIFAEAIGCNTMDKAYEAGLPVTIEKYGGGSPGLYVDEEGNNRIIEHNTIINTRYAGIFFHGAPGNRVRKNTCYGNREMQVLLVGRAFWAGRTRDRMRLVDDILEDNILFGTDAQQRTLFLGMHYDDVHFGLSDRNYFYNPYAKAHIQVARYVGGHVPCTLSLDEWRAMSGYDRNSEDISGLRRLPQVTLASPVKSRIVYNASLDVSTVDLGPDLYCDLQGNGISGKLVLQPFESKILITAVDVVVTQEATHPVPADGGQVGDVSVLGWSAAGRAACHDVYLGTDSKAVSAADTASPLFRKRQGATSFSLQGLVQPGIRYFWRIDEVETDGTTIHKGAVWTFTVADYLLVDDFERYADQDPDRIGTAWMDGSVNHTGAVVSRRSNLSGWWSDTSHGQWSMSLAYDNTQPPRVSVVERVFAVGQDWTAGGPNTLSLWFQGDVVSFRKTAPGTFTMSAAGADMWENRDEFRYAYQRLEGDGAIVAKVEHIDDTHYWAKAGVMIRQSLDPASAHASMLVTPSGLRAFQNRPANKSPTCFSAHGGAELKIPTWVKLERLGDQFTGYHSVDGREWIRQSETTDTGSDASPNPQTIRMPSLVFVGLALTSHASVTVGTAVFSDVEITASVVDRWQVADIGSDHPGNSPDALYVTVQDGNGRSATVVHPGPTPTNARTWTEWRIPLSSFSGVELGRVLGISVGVGGSDDATPPGAGTISIDDIRVGSTSIQPSRIHSVQPRLDTAK